MQARVWLALRFSRFGNTVKYMRELNNHTRTSSLLTTRGGCGADVVVRGAKPHPSTTRVCGTNVQARVGLVFVLFPL